MRFKIHLNRTGRNNLLPINYQYELSSWIYKTLHFGNPEFSEWIHSEGYLIGKKQFKLFTFSHLNFPDKGYTILKEKERLRVNSPNCHFYISMMMSDAAQNFILGLFKNQRFGLGDKQSLVDFEVGTIERIADPEFENTAQFRAISPIFVSKGGGLLPSGKLRQIYLGPEDEGYKHLLLENLTNKWLAIQKIKGFGAEQMDFSQFEFNLLSKPRTKLIKIKADTAAQTKLKGYLYDFELKAPKQLIEIAYNTGIGGLGSQGFGCLGEIK